MLPVRSALFKQRTGGLVVRWVTTSEYPLLYVYTFIFAPGWDNSMELPFCGYPTVYGVAVARHT
jgi:hypothetical protein